jgi:hypothetical protein
MMDLLERTWTARRIRLVVSSAVDEKSICVYMIAIFKVMEINYELHTPGIFR